MNIITTIILFFSVVGAVDFFFGNKFGVGAEFEKAFSLFPAMVFSMLGIIVIAPALGVWLTPAFDGFYNLFGVDPSILPASLFANDMGGMPLAQSVCKDPAIGNYNAFVVSSMMGCMISFTIPFSVGFVPQRFHKELFLGFLYGIVTIPIGCFVAGLMCKLSPLALLIDLLPLILLGIILSVGLIFLPKVCIKCFSAFGVFMKTLSFLGLLCAIFTFLTKVQISPHFDTLENAAFICVNACVTLSGALPFMFIVSKVLNAPLSKLGAAMRVSGLSVLALLGSLITIAPSFSLFDKMEKRGIVLNGAFAVSAAFVFASHLAFTMAFDPSYVPPMMVGKLVSGFFAALLVLCLYRGDTH